MFGNLHELTSYFRQPEYEQHNQFSGLRTFDCLRYWEGDLRLELPRLSVVIHSIDYLDLESDKTTEIAEHPLRFQQNTFRLWYQIDGHGILQNVTRKTFGTARPGLLGVMARGERHTYLHQRGHFSCFQILFSLLPSSNAKCYWNAGIEGKTVLEEKDRHTFENDISRLFLSLPDDRSIIGLAPLSCLSGLLVLLFRKGLILIEDSRFPKNKARSLVAKVRSFMDMHYSDVHHQRELEIECGVDINYLNILFKRETGITLYRYMTNVRLEHAKHYLETSSRAVSDIAMQCGYPNANSFSRAFKRLEKCSPQDYRTRHRFPVTEKPGKQSPT
ncbi:MAG: helix-turn-helix transcriptional regulator [Chitinispirillaceae bacterium]|nr:helix-turn-helix transcriptional regulator [Chitinispirillaceae bacterium]